jgi:hypothetical protein
MDSNTPSPFVVIRTTSCSLQLIRDCSERTCCASTVGGWSGVVGPMHGSMARSTHHDALFFTNARYAGFAEREDRVSSYYLTLRLG